MIQDNILDHFTIWVTFTGSRPRTRIFLECHVGIYVQLCVEWILRVPDEHEENTDISMWTKFTATTVPSRDSGFNV